MDNQLVKRVTKKGINYLYRPHLLLPLNKQQFINHSITICHSAAASVYREPLPLRAPFSTRPSRHQSLLWMRCYSSSIIEPTADDKGTAETDVVDEDAKK